MIQLSNYFTGVSAKRLRPVEIEPGSSNQHEFNGTVAMKGYLGVQRQVFKARFIFLGNDDERLSVNDQVTWYDARENHPTRSEYRLYFPDNEVINLASPGDVLITALAKNNELVLVVIAEDSPMLESVLWIFGLSNLPGTTFVTIETDSKQPESSAVFSYITEEIGLELETETSDDWLDLLLSKFGPKFPTTRELSGLARETLARDIDVIEHPDTSLISLMDREESMFRQLEREIVSRHLALNANNWATNVDDFISFSLSVQNRRKSRAGHALENHLEWIFIKNALKYERGVKTEGHSKPDFLFPGQSQYLDKLFPKSKLTMLGVKTSCKDRWRQVLNEAKRIEQKHLFTLQPSISEHQTNEMRDANLSLVIPESLHASFSPLQKENILTLYDFMKETKLREK